MENNYTGLERLIGKKVSKTHVRMICGGLGVALGFYVGRSDEGMPPNTAREFVNVLNQYKSVAAIWVALNLIPAKNSGQNLAEKLIHDVTIPATSFYAGVYLGRFTKYLF